VKGLEGQLQYRPDSATRLVLGFARTLIDSNDGDQTYSRSMPFTSLSMLASRRLGQGWSGSLAYYQVGAVSAMGEGGPVGLSRRWDGRIAREFNIGPRRAELALVAQNLFDEGYREFSEDNLMGRRAYVRFNLEM
jgi:outer membrane receptor protein involved in Fe transport